MIEWNNEDVDMWLTERLAYLEKMKKHFENAATVHVIEHQIEMLSLIQLKLEGGE